MTAVAQQRGGLAAAYSAFDLALRGRQAKLGYLMGIILIPTGLMLDYFVYPSLLWPNLNTRIVCSAVLLACLLALFTRWGQRNARILDKGCTIIPTLTVCWMIYESEGALSSYYAGLSLILVGASVCVPYTFREGAWFTLFVMVAYSLACLLHNTMRPAGAVDRVLSDSSGTLAANLYFLFGNGMMCAAASHYSSLRRFQDFSLRHELDANNKELASTLKKLQETEVQLVQSEKMNALGKLSAGLLHEINNPLNFTFMALRVAEQEAADNDSLKDTLKDIDQGMVRIRGVISDLRAFAYPSKLAHEEPFSLDEALTSALRLTAHELGELPVESDLKCGKVNGVKTQIVHVLMNLLMNSADALKAKSGGGRPRITISAAKRGERVLVSVKDNGTGVRKEDLPRLLEPFFTTKQVGQGMGLGLSICHTIVKNHGGQIEITSEHGQWTQVTFDLPVASSERPAPFIESPPEQELSLATAGSNA